MAKQLNVNLAFTADTSKAKAEVNSLQQSLAKISTSQGIGSSNLKIKKDLQEASAAATQLQHHLQKALNFDTGTLNFNAFNQSVLKSGTSVEKLSASLLKAGADGERTFMQLTNAIAKSEVPLTRANGVLKEFSTTLMNTVRWQISSSMIHGFVGGIQNAYRYAKDLNESLTNIRIVTNQSVEQMARFAEQANKAARALSTTTTDYTNASLIYYQQGLSDQEVKQRTDVTVKMANAAGISAEIASDQLTAIWNNFNNGTQSLEHYADVLVKLGAETASSSDEISQGMEKFASVAQTVGLSYEYAAAALATVTATTRQSADTVGTAFKTLFARLEGLQLGETLEDGTDLNKYSKALATVGVDIKDVSGQMKDMDTILSELGAKWDTLGKDQQIALAQTVGGMRQYTQLIALMDNWDFFEQNLAFAKNADGALQSQADIYAEGWEAARDRVRAASEAIFSDLLKDQGFIGLLNIFEDLLSGLNNFIDAMGGLRGILLVVGGIATKVFSNQIANGITNLGMGIKGLVLGSQYVQRQKQQVHDRMADSYYRHSTDINGVYKTGEDNARTAVIDSQVAAQRMYMAAAPRMNADQKMLAQRHLDEYAAYGERRINAARAADIAKASFEGYRAQMGISHNKTSADFNRVDTNLSLLRIGNQMYNNPKQFLQGYSDEELKRLKGQINGAVKGNNTDAIKDGDLKALQTNGAGAADALQRLIATLNMLEQETEQFMGEGKPGKEGIGMSDKEKEEYKKRHGNNKDKQEEQDKERKDHEQKGEDIKEALSQQVKLTGMEQIVQASSAFMSLGSAAMAAKGVIDVWNNTELSFGEKLITTLTSGSMAVMMLMQGLQSLSMVTQSFGITTQLATAFTKENSSSKLTNAIASKVQAMAKIQSQNAENADTAATLKNTAAKVANNIVLAAALIAVAALTAGIYLAVQAYNEDAIAAERAAKASEKLNEASQEAKTTLDSIKKSFEKYDTLTDKLQECTKGTQEWKDALNEVNNEVLNILEQYPDLNIQVKRDEDTGALSIENQEEIIQQAEERAERAQQAAIIGNIKADEAQLEADKTRATRLYASDEAVNYEDYDEVQEIDQRNRDRAGLINNVEDYIDEYGNLMSIEDLRAQFDEQTISESFYNALEELANKTFSVATELDNAAIAISSLEFGEGASNAEVDTGSEIFKTKESEIYQEIMTAGQSFGRTATKNNDHVANIWSRYLEASGNNYTLARNAVQGGKNNRYFAYIPEEGGQEQTISLEQVAATIATYEAKLALSESKDEISQAVDQIGRDYEGRESSTVQSTIFDTAILDYIASKNFDSITKLEQDEVREKTLNDEGVIDSSAAKAYWADAYGGLNNLEYFAEIADMTTESYVEALTTAALEIDFGSIGDILSNKTREVFDKVFKEVEPDNSSSLEDTYASMQYEDQEALAQAFDTIHSVGGLETIKNLGDVFDELDQADLNPEEIQAILDAFANTDWSSITSIEEFEAKIAELSPVAQQAAENLVPVIARIKELLELGESVSTEDAQLMYKTAMDVVNSLSDTKRILSKDSYNALAEVVGEEILSGYVTELADGDFQLNGIYENFSADMREAALSTFYSAIDQNRDARDAGRALLESNDPIPVLNETIAALAPALTDKAIDRIIGDDASLLNYSNAELFSQLSDGAIANNLTNQDVYDFIKEYPTLLEETFNDIRESIPDIAHKTNEQILSELSEGTLLEYAMGNMQRSFNYFAQDSTLNGIEPYDADVAADQLEFIKAVNGGAEYEFENGDTLEEYITALEEGALTAEQYANVVKEIQTNIGEEGFNSFVESIGQNNEQLVEQIELIATLSPSIGDLNTMLLEQVENGNITLEEANQIYTNVLDTVLQTQAAEWDIPYEDVLKRADAMSKLEQYQDISIEQLKEMAFEIEANNKAMIDLAENGEEYLDILTNKDLVEGWDDSTKASADTQKQIDAAKKSLSKLLDVPINKVSSKMAKAAMQSKYFEKAIQGDEKAMHALRGELNKAGEFDDVFKDILPDDADQAQIDEMRTKLSEVNDFIQGELDKGLSAGEIDLSSMEASLNEMIAMCGSDVEAAKALLAALGISAELVPVDDEVIESSYEPPPLAVSAGSETHTNSCFDDHEHKNIAYQSQSAVETTTTVGAPPSWKIKDGTGKVISEMGNPKGGGGGGGGGGGKAKPPKPLKRINPKVRYEGVKKQLDNLGKQQDKIAQQKEAAYGKEKIKQAEKEIELKQRQIKLQTEYMEETKNALELQKIDVADSLKAIGAPAVEFDIDGSIKNYAELKEALLNYENDMIRAENAGADEFYMAAMEERFDTAREGFDNLQEIIEDALDAELEYYEALNELAELNLELIQMEVDMDIELAEAKLEYIDYMLEKLKDEGYDAADAIAQMGNKVETSLDQIGTYTNAITELLSRYNLTIEDLQNATPEDLIGLGIRQDEVEALLEWNSGLIESLTTLSEIRTEVADRLSGAFGAFSEDLSRQIDLFEHYNGLLEHFSEIATLTGSKFAKSEFRDLFNTINNSIMVNSQNNIRASKQQLEDLRAAQAEILKAYNDAVALNDGQAIFEYKEALQEIEDAIIEAEETFYSSFEDTLDKATELLETWVEQAGERFDEVLSPMYKSLDLLQDAYDRQVDKNSNFYQDFEQLYHLSQLTRDISNSIDDTDSIKGKQRLRDLMKEITDIQAQGVKLSEYDADILRKRYELEVARQNLEDAYDNASLVRLQRDQEGNWGYVYTADEEAVDEAEKEYENKLYELQKANDEYIKELEEKYLDITANVKEQLAEIASDISLTPEEKDKQMKDILNYYETQTAHYTQQLESALTNQKNTYDLTLEMYKVGSANLMDAYHETNLGLLGMYDSTDALLNGLTTSMRSYIKDLQEGIDNFDKNINDTNIAAGVEDTFGFLEEKIEGVNDRSKETLDLAESIGDAFIEEFGKIGEEISNIENMWASMITSIIGDTELLAESLIKAIEILREYNTEDTQYKEAWDEYQTAQQKYLKGLGKEVTIAEIRYSLADTDNAEWEAAKDAWNQFLVDWMKQKSGGIEDSGQSFNTGGYTGEWGPDGRLAWLHQKELILNASDTENLLDAIGIVRALELNVDTFTNRLADIMPMVTTMEREAFQQEIYITAEFPDATSAMEIQEAFENLINDAAQYAYQR